MMFSEISRSYAIYNIYKYIHKNIYLLEIIVLHLGSYREKVVKSSSELGSTYRVMESIRTGKLTRIGSDRRDM